VLMHGGIANAITIADCAITIQDQLTAPPGI
jgi:hypothetical protein